MFKFFKKIKQRFARVLIKSELIKAKTADRAYNIDTLRIVNNLVEGDLRLWVHTDRNECAQILAYTTAEEYKSERMKQFYAWAENVDSDHWERPAVAYIHPLCYGWRTKTEHPHSIAHIFIPSGLRVNQHTKLQLAARFQSFHSAILWDVMSEDVVRASVYHNSYEKPPRIFYLITSELEIQARDLVLDVISLERSSYDYNRV